MAAGWAFNDPVAAAHWMEVVRSGNDRDTAIAAFVKAVGANNPSVASGWLPKIRDASTRADAAESFAEDWMKLDTNGARKWIDATRFLSPETKRKLLDAK